MHTSSTEQLGKGQQGKLGSAWKGQPACALLGTLLFVHTILGTLHTQSLLPPSAAFWLDVKTTTTPGWRPGFL